MKKILTIHFHLAICIVFFLFLGKYENILATDLSSTYRMRSTICAEVKLNKCGCDFSKPILSRKIPAGIKFKDSEDDDFYKKLRYNKLGYGVPFIGNTPMFVGKCNCEKIMAAKVTCDKMNQADPLYPASEANLAGVIINEQEKSKKPQEKKKFTNLRATPFRFKQAPSSITKLHKMPCNCLVENEARSLFCEDECKAIMSFTEGVRKYYDNMLKKTEEYFNTEFTKISNQ